MRSTTVSDRSPVRATVARRPRIPWVVLTAMLASCASSPAARRATRIADADLAAKEAVARESRIEAASFPARSLAVVPFTVSGRDSLLDPLSFGLPALLSNDLAVSPDVLLVERIKVDAMLRELDLVEAGIVDPSQAPRVGRLVGARRLLMGTLNRADNNTIRLDVRIVDVLGGTVQDVAATSAPIDRVIDAEKALAVLVFDRLGIVLTPAQRARVEARQTTQLAALVAFGRGVEYEARGDAVGAANAFAEAARIDRQFAMPAVRSPLPRASHLQRVLGLSVEAINVQGTARTADVAAPPLAASAIFALILNIRIIP